MEDLVDIFGDGRYFIDKDGNVFNANREVLKTYVSGSGYKFVKLYIDGRSRTFYIHKLVAEKFLDGDYGDGVIAHYDGDKSNNRYENLEVRDVHRGRPGTKIKVHLIGMRSVYNENRQCERVDYYDSYREFNSFSECAKYYGVSRQVVRYAYLNNSGFYVRDEDGRRCICRVS